jgi:hypothetical protein
LGNGTLTFTEGGRSIRITYQEPASLMTVETQQGAAGPQTIRVVEIGADTWQWQGTGRWTHFTDDPPPGLPERIADQVRQAATVDQTGSTFTVPAYGPDNASFGGAGMPVHITLAANGTPESLSGTAVIPVDEGSATSTVPFRAVFSQMWSTPPITAPPSDQVDDSRPSGGPVTAGSPGAADPAVSTPGHRASTA